MGVTKNAIARNIFYYRKKAGFSQNDIANKLGVSVPAVSKWENGSNSIDIDTLFELCNVLGITINEISDLNTSFDEIPYHSNKLNKLSKDVNENDLEEEIEFWREKVVNDIYNSKLDIRQLKELRILIQAFDRL